MLIKIVEIIAFLALSLIYLKHALHTFQQNRYEFERYTKWLLKFRNIQVNEYFTYIAMCGIASYVFVKFLDKGITIPVIVVTIIFAVKRLMEENKKEYIKPLVYTARVKRQIAVIAILDIIFVSALVLAEVDLLVIAVLIAPCAWLGIYLMAIITLPMENGIKKHYENEARAIISSMHDLKTIGITGSFGKTSTKNIVENILGDSYYTLMTPASYNTPMGITITIRQLLKPIHEVFVCEMGADHVGEISYLMDFVKPKYGIVTSVGPQHLNTFHSMENIINEKMEMIEMLPSDGLGVINIDNEYIRNYKIKNDVRVVTVGINNQEADYVAKDINYDIDGSTFTVNIKGEDVIFNSVLLGEHNIMNILTGIALASELGIDNKTLVKSVAHIKRIEHRLELKKINGYTFVDNAFNSNPVGCKLSLDVLAKMPGRHVIVTPGLIDLGPKEDEYNQSFGEYMLNRADIVILVGKNQTRAIVKGLNAVGFDMGNVIVKDTVKEAFTYIYTHLSTSDTILLENDLPDAFSN